MTLLKYLGGLSAYFQLRNDASTAQIDNGIFRLHYRLTSGFFFGACLLLSASELLGKPIFCIHSSSACNSFITTYCWIQHTFTLPTYASNLTIGRTAEVYPGVRSENLNDARSPSERQVHSYYQWVPFALFFQGILFCLPRWIWKHVEGGRTRQMTEGCRGVHLSLSVVEERLGHCAALSHYLFATRNISHNLAAAYFSCHLLNLVNAVGNIFFIDRFLGGSFLRYGILVAQFSGWDQEERSDPLIDVFPRMTKCTFHSYGKSGSIMRQDSLCILPLNVFNEKIYVFAWFWLVILALISALDILKLLYEMKSVNTRVMLIRRKAPCSFGTVQAVVKHISYGDFFRLRLIGKNLNSLLFYYLISEFGNRIGHTAQTYSFEPPFHQLRPSDPKKRYDRDLLSKTTRPSRLEE